MKSAVPYIFDMKLSHTTEYVTQHKFYGFLKILADMKSRCYFV